MCKKEKNLKNDKSNYTIIINNLLYNSLFLLCYLNYLSKDKRTKLKFLQQILQSDFTTLISDAHHVLHNEKLSQNAFVKNMSY